MEIQKNKPVAFWLLTGAVMIIIQILIGGITRLTGSGLSITEWQPLLGTLPPMNESQWNEAFDKYKEIAQYKYIHNYFTLSDFKFIYFWEWFHRNWGRLMGLVFAIPFVYFLYKKKINRTMLWPMIILFLLGGLQGALGWIMVKSGIGTDLVYVSHIRLAIHFIAALILLVYVIWFALKISVPKEKLTFSPYIKWFSVLILFLLGIQLVYGAFMAGTHAAKSAITWPTINGSFFPKMFNEGAFLHDVTNNLITIQFVHRNLAYLLVILILVYSRRLSRQPINSFLFKWRWLPVILVTVQVTLGILSLINYLNNNKLIFSILHQLVGILLLCCIIIFYYFGRGKNISK